MSQLEIVEMRPQVSRFAHFMEEALRRHDHDRGERGWIGDKREDLFRRLIDETLELHQAIVQANLPGNRNSLPLIRAICREAIDVGNFAMMIMDKAEQDVADENERMKP